MTAICRTKPGGNTAEDGAPGTRSLSDAQRMRKVIMELVETERAYVKVSVDSCKWAMLIKTLVRVCVCVCVCVSPIGLAVSADPLPGAAEDEDMCKHCGSVYVCVCVCPAGLAVSADPLPGTTEEGDRCKHCGCVCVSVLQDLLCLLTGYLEPLKKETGVNIVAVFVCLSCRTCCVC